MLTKIEILWECRLFHCKKKSKKNQLALVFFLTNNARLSCKPNWRLSESTDLLSQYCFPKSMYAGCREGERERGWTPGSALGGSKWHRPSCRGEMYLWNTALQMNPNMHAMVVFAWTIYWIFSEPNVQTWLSSFVRYYMLFKSLLYLSMTSG